MEGKRCRCRAAGMGLISQHYNQARPKLAELGDAESLAEAAVAAAGYRMASQPCHNAQCVWCAGPRRAGLCLTLAPQGSMAINQQSWLPPASRLPSPPLPTPLPPGHPRALRLGTARPQTRSRCCPSFQGTQAGSSPPEAARAAPPLSPGSLPVSAAAAAPGAPPEDCAAGPDAVAVGMAGGRRHASATVSSMAGVPGQAPPPARTACWTPAAAEVGLWRRSSGARAQRARPGSPGAWTLLPIAVLRREFHGAFVQSRRLETGKERATSVLLGCVWVVVY